MKKPRSFLVIFFIAVIAAAIIVRYAQFIAEIIDFGTGFFLPYAGALKYLHYIVLGVSFVGFIIFAITEKRRKTSFFTKRLSHLDEADTASSGIMLLLSGAAVVYIALTEGFGDYGYVGVLTALLGAAAYCFSGAVLFFKKRTYPSVGIAFLALSGYYVARLVMVFLGKYVIINMSEHLVNLLITLFLSLFYLSLGRMFMRAENKTTRIKVCIFGFTAAFIAVSETVAKLIFLFGSPSVTRDNLMHSSATEFIEPSVLSVAETVALVVLLMTLVKPKQEGVKSGKGAVER
ncbi:MAG: hypothetical protein FWG70_06795 [Oscillospiraceae bacterium]|nr:hypothetical protein [Oscillospiraceae bacterium]